MEAAEAGERVAPHDATRRHEDVARVKLPCTGTVQYYM